MRGGGRSVTSKIVGFTIPKTTKRPQNVGVGAAPSLQDLWVFELQKRLSAPKMWGWGLFRHFKICEFSKFKNS